MTKSSQAATFSKASKLAQALLRDSKGSISFVKSLLKLRVPHISYSSISSVEFCERRYFFEYVAMRRVSPTPEYFVKGKVFHDIAARFYLPNSTRKKLVTKTVTRRIKNEASLAHIDNGVKLLVKNAWNGWSVIGTELPFVFDMHSNLPPFIGIIDLLLKKDETYAVIDHKTGKSFNQLDKHQLVLYLEHVKRTYQPEKCIAYYDEYRWVNDIERIRKPAFRRTPVKTTKKSYTEALVRAKDAYRKMSKILSIEDTNISGDCWNCPYRHICQS